MLRTKNFITDNFILQSSIAETLYHEYARDLPIIDYHNHLSAKQIADNKPIANITKAWLSEDHYKWRAMRANGVDEAYITGKNTTDKEKFDKWAETVPYTLRNPLFHWTHLELKRYFDIDELLQPKTATSIFEKVNSVLKQKTPAQLLQDLKVEVVCTTDDPCDGLHYHEAMKSSKTLKMLPAFRPDKAYTFAGSASYATYVQKLAEASSVNISSLQGLFTALENRVNYFHDHGCRAADHGLETLPFSNITEKEAEKLFIQALEGHPLTTSEAVGLRFIILSHLSTLYHSKGWVQQFHLGALRNNNDRMLRELGPDTGFDSIGDFPQAQTMARYFNHLDSSNQLAKTILYNLNPADNELFATMTGNFNDGTTAGKMQWGSGWWYLDQKDGMEKQMNTLSNMGLLSVFVGMVTDSRSFLSFPRHEYFRRILCNLIGEDVKNGELPNDMALLGQMVEDVCYNNAKTYFGF